MMQVWEFSDGFSWVTAVVLFVKTLFSLEQMYPVDKEHIQFNVECF
jgi:hypothetical protein